MYLDDYPKIIGKTIESYEMNAEKTSLILRTTDGALHFYADGDCCSESWIEHITTPKLPAKILSIEQKDLPTPPPSGRQESDVAYSTIFKTDQGDFEVEYRNSSNGYYGGSLRLEKIEVKDDTPKAN